MQRNVCTVALKVAVLWLVVHVCKKRSVMEPHKSLAVHAQSFLAVKPPVVKTDLILSLTGNLGEGTRRNRALLGRNQQPRGVTKHAK